MFLNFQCRRSENNTVDPFLPLIVFRYFPSDHELGALFFSWASNSVSIFSCTSSLDTVGSGVQDLFLTVHLQYLEGNTA